MTNEKKTPIAVVGMAGLFPGASDLDTFWQNIVNKKDTTGEVPPGRWIADLDDMYHPDPMPDKAFSKRACLIQDFKFDHKGLYLDEDLLNALDPLHQMALHIGRDALLSCDNSSINKKNIGIVLAAIALPTDASSSITRKILGTSFEEKLFGSPLPEKYQALSKEACLAARVTSLPAALLAKALGLGGGTMTLDAACASSVYAVKLACDELLSYRADAMLAGGISRPECLYTQVGFSQLRALSPSGRCAPFDETANGLVVGEGVGILVLKRLDDALRDMDTIYAVIKGIGLSNDMRGNLLAPDSEGQVRAMQSAYAAAGWSPQDVDLIECHGAGTPVGDVIELQSLRNLWKESTWSTGQCAIGSIKSMIGHLLTGAGAAGMIKTLLALKHKILPPSLNFNRAAGKSPLHNSPFRVQTEPEPWTRRDEHTPRRAAVSAFGFGGINSHLLFEEWDFEIENCQFQISNCKSSTISDTSGSSLYTNNQQSSIFNLQSSIKKPPIAIIGMAAAFGPLTSLRAFQETLLKGESIISKRPEGRWNGCDAVAENYLGQRAAWGGFMDELSIDLQEFRIPPNEIPDILIQHLLMLKVSMDAMKDAGLPLKQERPRMGAFIGIDFDFEATDFHLRWNLINRVREWKKERRLDLDLDGPKNTDPWLASLQDTFRPPLTNTRTLGALGGIIASRIAREFRFGGPSYVVSNDAASGLKALEIGVRSLQQHETDTVLVGAVDLFGDVRSVIVSDQIRPFTKKHDIRPFDTSADGTLPGEGAAAVVLKRLDQAITDNDRIYSVIKGMGKAGSDVKNDSPSKDVYVLSLKRSFQDAGISPSTVSFVETHGSGNPLEDRIESEALIEVFNGKSPACAVGSVMPNIGHTGAAAGLAALVKTSLFLYRKIIPPLTNFVTPASSLWKNSPFYMPAFPQYWSRDRKEGPRRACIGSMTLDSNCMHAILEGLECDTFDQDSEKIFLGRKRPLGFMDSDLFVVEGNNQNEETLATHKLPVDLDTLYGTHAVAPVGHEIHAQQPERLMKLPVGGKIPSPSLPKTSVGDQPPARMSLRLGEGSASDSYEPTLRPVSPTGWKQDRGPGIGDRELEGAMQYSELMNTLTETTKATADAHQAFLDFSNTLTQRFEKTFETQTKLLETLIADEHLQTEDALVGLTQRKATQQPIEPAFDRAMCMEFAIGSVEKVLGPEFAVVDTHNVRVRLPDEPLMLVDRILSVQGEKQSMGSGRVVTEHDVLPEAWYLDGGRAPVCISVEAGQADLFLCSYLGIDHAVKGERSYRLLDAKVKFLRSLPQPGDVIRYEIKIDHFSRQGKTYLFFFKFKGYIGDSHLISMTDGCAGFFTEEEVRTSGGIILTAEDTQRQTGQKPSDWKDLVPLKSESYEDAALESLRQGDLSECFGRDFIGIQLAESLRLPGGRMKLIHRILKLDPEGGRYGLGLIRAEADIHPDDWFLTCHFMDDMVMPGTLMYECCAHTLRVFIQRMGWITTKSDVCYEPVIGVESTLKCRGPVTPETRKVWYDIEIKELGYAPEPYVIADALMVADGHRIVSFKDMSMKMTGITRDEIESLWEKIGIRDRRSASDSYEPTLRPGSPTGWKPARRGIGGQKSEVRRQKTEDREQQPALYNRDKILSFANGKPSEAFGKPYKMFDKNRVIARLPGPPYSFLDRIVAVEPEAWILKPDGWIEAEYDMSSDAWYFRADRSSSMPFCVLLEVALQPCGWLAAYLGSALKSENDLKFRNLGGNAVLHRMIFPEEKKLTIRARMTKVSEAAEMIIEHFDFMVLQDTETIYSGDTYFGFFTKQALSQQVGIRNAEKTAYMPSSDELRHSRTFIFEDVAPLFPEDTDVEPASSLAMPANALRMIDSIDAFVPNGGPQGLGYIRGVKKVEPDEWFFKAHFFQDPVCPGSLGIESFLQLIKFAAMNRWPHLAETHRFEWIMNETHSWSYRGQVIPENKQVEVDAVITKMVGTPEPTLYANGFLKVDGRYIYHMENFGLRLISL